MGVSVTDRYKWSFTWAIRPYKWPKINGFAWGYFFILLITIVGAHFVGCDRWISSLFNRTVTLSELQPCYKLLGPFQSYIFPHQKLVGGTTQFFFIKTFSAISDHENKIQTLFFLSNTHRIHVWYISLDLP